MTSALVMKRPMGLASMWLRTDKGVNSSIGHRV
jgi:hypothetical protein